GRYHQPEFTLLEWYRRGWSWRELAQEVADLVRFCLGAGRDEWPIRWMAWNDCFREVLQIDALSAATSRLRALADDAPSGLERDGLLDWLFATRIQPAFARRTLTVVH